jgi:hypothetical protein
MSGAKNGEVSKLVVSNNRGRSAKPVRRARTGEYAIKLYEYDNISIITSPKESVE